jgi:hypothetical protein
VTLSFSGVTSQNISGRSTYSINEDCTGSLAESNGVTANLVFVNNRNEIFAMDTFPGVTDYIIFKRVNTR